MTHSSPGSAGFRRMDCGPKDDTAMDRDFEQDLAALFASPAPDRLRHRIQALATSLEDPSKTAGARGPIVLPVGRTATRTRRRFRPATWLSGVAAALVIVLLVGGVALATGVINLDTIFQYGFGTRHIVEKDQGVELNMTQQVDGFTVTLGRAYADPFQTVLAVSVQAPKELGTGRVDLRKGTVYDDQGQFLSSPPWQAGGGGQDGVDTYLLQRYTNPYEGHPASLTYRYEIDQIHWERGGFGTPLPVQGAPPGTECEPFRNHHSVSVEVIPGAGCEAYTFTTSTPIIFDFTVPLADGVNLVPGPQTASNGTIAQVNHIASAESGTRMDISGVGPLASVSIDAGDKTYPLKTLGYGCPYDATTRFSYQTEEAIPKDVGPWTVHIDVKATGEQPSSPMQGDAKNLCQALNVTGSWQFTVDPTA